MAFNLRAAWDGFWNRSAAETSTVEPVDSRAEPTQRPAWQGWNGSLVRTIRAAYEAGMVRSDLWTLADFRDADATLLPHIRRRIRSRARYEVANNPQVDRVLKVWVDDVVGQTGPWPKLQTGNAEVDKFIERAWLRWWRVSGQAAKLRTAVRAEASDGESIGVIFHNERIMDLQAPDSAVSVDIGEFEADRLADPSQTDAARSDYIDGVHLDPWTRVPVAYDLLKAHPGTENIDQLGDQFEAQTFSRNQFLHVFRKNRPEQHRGVCRFVAALPVAGLLRKYAEAEVTRAGQTAAHTVLYESNAAPEDEETGGGNESQWWQTVDLPGRAGLASILPEGLRPTQLNTVGNAAELEECRDLIAGMIAGCFSMPVSRAVGSSPNGGYPGMRNDLLPYHTAIGSDRAQVWEPHYLVPLFRAFLHELRMTPAWERLMDSLTVEDPGFAAVLLDLMNVEWRWPGRDLVVDPSREQEALRKKMAMGTALREDEVDGDLYEHDRRAAESLGLGNDEAGVTKYRQLVACWIHQVQTLDPAAQAAAEGEESPGEGD